MLLKKNNYEKKKNLKAKKMYSQIKFYIFYFESNPFIFNFQITEK